MISITSIASLSALGNTQSEIWQAYLSKKTFISQQTLSGEKYLQSCISTQNKLAIHELRLTNKKYASLDETVLFAIFVARQAIHNAGWKKGSSFGINIGSSRGATQLFEKYHQAFLSTNKVPPLTSPSTTLGNISSWVAHDLHSTGPEISHSVTCSTALHAILNGVAWLRSGMTDQFIVGASEAALTAFTLKQMQALKITAQEKTEFPCRAFDLNKKINTMVLGEAAAVACLENGQKENALAYILGVGYAIDHTENNIGISDAAVGLQQAMRMALGNIHVSEIDAVIMHAPGTIKGDLAEFKAIQEVFGTHMPMLTTNKWQVGHSLGTAGMLSIEMAILMMQHQIFIPVPFAEPQKIRPHIKKVLVNALGFGGNAVSLLLCK